MNVPGRLQAVDFTAFMRRYQDMVYSTAARITNDPAQAEDIAQAVFLKAYEQFDELATAPTAPGWLKTVATNLSLNHLTRYRKRFSFIGDWRRDADADSTADSGAEEALPEFSFDAGQFEEVADEQRQQLIERALKSLPEHQRLPLVLFHFSDMPYQEIAVQLKVSEAKVKSDIFRARAALLKHVAIEAAHAD
jgi:RNA polymerase sigma-70 factor (ECF subfamily)